MADTCRSCSMTLPGRLNERLSAPSLASSPSGGAKSPTTAKGNNPILRTKEVIISSAPFLSSEDEDETSEGQLPSYIRRRRATIDREHLPSSPNARSYFNSTPASDDEATGGKSSLGSSTHTHHITYLSTSAPSVPSRFSTLRQSCVRTLSCELIPAQTGPIMFGDPLAGYTIAYVFRLADSKARGERRSYALVCICPDQKIVVKSWKYVVAAFEALVHRIKLLAAKKAAEDAQVSPALGNSISSITSRGPDGFLRRRAPGEGGSQKGLAELVGREELFVEVHMCFVKLLGGLVRRYGCWAGSELGLSIGTTGNFVTPVMGRSRAGSVSSSVGDEKPEKKTVTSQTVVVVEGIEMTGDERAANGATKVTFPPATAGLSVHDTVTSRAAPSTPRAPAAKREEPTHQRSRSAILIH
ncbi:vesicle coat protein [Tuber brumale]|nr:vesicle coat protein [Tuber brumale]